MSRKTAVWGGMIIGSSIGGFIPALWSTSASPFTFSGIILSAIGAVIGILIGFRLGD